MSYNTSFDRATVLHGETSQLTANRLQQCFRSTSKSQGMTVGSDVAMGATGVEVCLVNTIIYYISLRGRRQGAFFKDSSHKAWLKSWFVAQIRETLDAIGLVYESSHYLIVISLTLGALCSSPAGSHFLGLDSDLHIPHRQASFN